MEHNLKVLILLFYYNRPEMVKNSLQSIVNSTYSNYEVAFINDSGEESSNHILEFIKNTDIYSNFKQYNINQSTEEKVQQGGSIFGKYANTAIRESDADIVIMLCDDDALLPDYLFNLNNYYKESTEVMWAYSKVKYYNPTVESYLEATEDLQRVQSGGSVVDLNLHTEPINPDCKCDASQVSFRRACFMEKNIEFPYPKTRNLDSAIYSKMYQEWDSCYHTNFHGQCKGVFSDQLGCRIQADFKVSIN